MAVSLLLLTLVGAECTTPDRSAHVWDGVRLALITWAEGVVHKNSAQVGTVLHESFPDRDVYLERVARNALGGISYGGVTQIVTRYADYARVDDGVRASPVVVLREKGTMRWALTLTFIKEGNVWQITSIGDAPELHEEMIATDLPEHSVLRSVSVSVRDADGGGPIVTRVHVSDRNGVYWPPDGHMKNVPVEWHEHVGGDVKLEGKTYAYVEPDFTLSLPEGSWRQRLRLLRRVPNVHLS